MSELTVILCDTSGSLIGKLVEAESPVLRSIRSSFYQNLGNALHITVDANSAYLIIVDRHIGSNVTHLDPLKLYKFIERIADERPVTIYLPTLSAKFFVNCELQLLYFNKGYNVNLI